MAWWKAAGACLERCFAIRVVKQELSCGGDLWLENCQKTGAKFLQTQRQHAYTAD
jgi:hypothetical protein